MKESGSMAAISPSGRECMLCEQPLSKVMNLFTGAVKVGVCVNPICPGKVAAGRLAQLEP